MFSTSSVSLPAATICPNGADLLIVHLLGAFPRQIHNENAFPANTNKGREGVSYFTCDYSIASKPRAF
ncbi:MAG: hypothetical protein ILA30_00125, partial [Selenomonas sp.]|nr:hypothetical protein [Selenomonas sp.]